MACIVPSREERGQGTKETEHRQRSARVYMDRSARLGDNIGATNDKGQKSGEAATPRRFCAATENACATLFTPHCYLPQRTGYSPLPGHGCVGAGSSYRA